MANYTPATWALIRAADRRYTRAFLDAVTASERAPLAEAAGAYNAIMIGAHLRWNTECADAVHPPGEDEF